MDSLDDSSRTLSGDSVTSDETLIVEPDDLTHDQIDSLLRRAVMRRQLETNELSLFRPPKPSRKKLPYPKPIPSLPTSYTKARGGVVQMKQKRLIDERQKQLAEISKRVTCPVDIKKRKVQSKTSLVAWYNMPKTISTPGLIRDFQALHMRSVIDTKRMYKKQGKFKLPEYSQMGVILEGPTEYHNARIENKQRKQTFVEEIMAGEQETGRVKVRYEELQLRKKSGKRAYYKMLQSKRQKTKKGG